MLVYDPHTNGTGWVAMKGIPASLTEVEARSVEELGNFYPAPRITREEPQATQSPPEEVTVSHGPPKAETPKPKTGTVEANVDWDTDDVQVWSCSPSLLQVLVQSCWVSPQGRTSRGTGYMPRDGPRH